jgi:SAM-dependent methyltransferase
MHAADNQSGNFSGVWQIFLYNWHFYAAALVLDLIAAVFMIRFSSPAAVRFMVVLGAAISTFWALSSLLVSYYVYDRSRLYQWNWLGEVLKRNPASWVNIHAGLDQSSKALIRLFPAAKCRILDVYVSSEMSEPSIARARRHIEPAAASEKADPRALPLKNGECDTVFLLFVAHELRRQKAKLEFFREVGRALKPGGCVVLVEHLRDWKNLLAYGPGALHFFSRREWLSVGNQAGFQLADELRITPFVRCIILAKNPPVKPDRSGSASCA